MTIDDGNSEVLVANQNLAPYFKFGISTPYLRPHMFMSPEWKKFVGSLGSSILLCDMGLILHRASYVTMMNISRVWCVDFFFFTKCKKDNSAGPHSLLIIYILHMGDNNESKRCQASLA